MNLKAINSSLLFFSDSGLPKAIFILGIALTLVLQSLSQEKNPKDSLTSDYHLQKSKSQKITGFICLGLGVTTVAVLSRGETDFDVLPVLAIGGLSAAVISIPLFISAGKNKRKAMSLSVKKEKTFLVRNGAFTQRSFPAISLKFNLSH